MTTNVTQQRKQARTAALEWIAEKGIQMPDFLNDRFARFYAKYTVDVPGHVGWAESIDDFFLAWENGTNP